MPIAEFDEISTWTETKKYQRENEMDWPCIEGFHACEIVISLTAVFKFKHS